jgi:iron(III) transport system substrate-binding protein
MKISFWVILILIVMSFLSSCGPGISVSANAATPLPPLETAIPIKPQLPNFPTETPSLLGQYLLPPYYTDYSYVSIVNRSKTDKELIIYSIMNEENWLPIIRIFKSHYPWIKITTFNLSPTEVFSRYNNDLLENKRTADIVISSDQMGWLKFSASNSSSVMPYSSQEDLLLPDWSKPKVGVYTVSSEPMVIIYNKKLVPAPPQSMTDLAALVKSDLSAYKGQIVTYNAELNTSGFTINWFWIKNKDQAGWDILNTLGDAQPLLMISEDDMIAAVSSGRAKIGYFISTKSVVPRLATDSDLGWSYVTDGQPVLLNNMAITKEAASPNSAKLMVDFLLSQEGQYALALGGLTPYRSDISGIAEYHLDKISVELGDNNIILSSLDDQLRNQPVRDSFIEKWKAAVQRQNLPGHTK